MRNKIMKLLSIIILFCNCFFPWTTAVSFEYKTYFVTIQGNVLENITVTSNTSHVDLSDIRIKFIMENALDRLANIESLDLSRNRIRILEPAVFPKLQNLKVLLLAHNLINLNHMEQPFIGLKNLKVLDLTDNRLSSVDGSFFVGLPKSTNIIIEGNPLTQMITKAPIPQKRVNKSENAPLKKSYRRSVEQYYIKVCQTVDGIVESIGIIGTNESFGNCTSAVETLHDGRTTLKFDVRTVTGFKRGWYGRNLSHDSIDLSGNFITEITQVFSHDLPSSVSHIDLSYNFLSTIEDGAFEKLNLTVLNVSRNKFKSTAFVRALPSSLKELNCEDNSISEMPPDSFRRLENLEGLILRGNNLKEIGSKTFEFQRNLRSLDLGSNKIFRVEPDSFSGLEKLEILVMEGNKLKEIGSQTFQFQKNLRSLDLAFNQIRRIESGSLLGLKNLEVLVLKNNHLKEIGSKTFEFLKNLRSLDLSFNQIRRIESESFQDLEGSVKIDLSHNEIGAVPRDAFNKNLNILKLNSNRISRIEPGAFLNMTCKLFDLSYNKITENVISNGAFNGSAIEYLYLSHNSMTKIYRGTFENFSVLSSLRLNNNPITEIEEGAMNDMEKIDILDLSQTQVTELNSGALFGLSTERSVWIMITGTRLRVIQAGVLDD